MPESAKEDSIGPDVRSFDTEGLTVGSLRYDMLFGIVAFDRLLDTCIERFLIEPDKLDVTSDGASKTAYDNFADHLDNARQQRQIPVAYTPFIDDDHTIPLSEGPTIKANNPWGVYGAMLSTELSEATSVIDQQWIDASVRRPDLFASTPDTWVTDRLTAFGQAYLHDMYVKIGIAAPGPNSRLAVEEQVTLIENIFAAVHKMGNVEAAMPIPFDTDEKDYMRTARDEDGHPYYDPLRLSPNAYPNNDGIKPTCAAQMAMLAGFFEVAGWPHMTANTLTLGEVYSRTCLERFTKTTEELYAIKRLVMHPADQRVFTMTHKANNAILRKDLGFHGCNIVKLNDGAWWQCDLTRGIWEAYDQETSERLDRAYDSLQAGRIANTPMAYAFNELEVMNYYDHISDASIDAASRILPVNTIQDGLRALGRNPTIDKIINNLIMPVVLPSGQVYKDEHARYLRKYYDNLILQHIPHTLRSPIQGRDFVHQTIRQLMINQAFLAITNTRDEHGAILSPHRDSHAGYPCGNDCLKQTLQWPNNHDLLVTWIQSAPLMFYQKLANDITRKSLEPEHLLPHPSLELTNPAMYLGAVVMSAYAGVYATPEEELPAAWWQTYDPTHSGSLIHLYDALGTSSEPAVVNIANFFSHFPNQSLLDTSKRLRIKKFLKEASQEAHRPQKA